MNFKKVLIKSTSGLILAVMFFSAPFGYAFASDKSNCIYESKINEVISFYQGRLYLSDSEYKILSDIGKDAAKIVDFLQAEKSQLINEMKVKGVPFKTAEMKAFAVRKARISHMGLAYTSLQN